MNNKNTPRNSNELNVDDTKESNLDHEQVD